MVLDDIARIVCQIDRAYPLYLRAITLFGFQVAILCPNQARRESKARVLAALKILESLETGVQSDVNLESRLEIPDYRDVLNAIMREGGAKAIRVAGTTEDFWKEIKKRLGEVEGSRKMVEILPPVRRVFSAVCYCSSSWRLNDGPSLLHQDGLTDAWTPTNEL